jgi:transcriptional regulator with XRE-family HTH domain
MTARSRLVAFLERNQLTQSELARRAGLDPSTVNKIVNGQRIPDLRVAVALAVATGGEVAAESWVEVQHTETVTDATAADEGRR